MRYGESGPERRRRGKGVTETTLSVINTFLAVAVCAVLAGAGTFTEIAQRSDRPVGARVRLGPRRMASSESTKGHT
jgi:hypothetical protein